ncbi:hypothetical protein DUNSADRAFT_10970 [Dunaliella salina]|uniref:Rad50/SbcC-type AAA domain-containing protein n=1 Tax=Dunaliella salina TaxID=3046 RepID=A0ABQ7GEE6_DUNSA|nr:hypothetical protein DUNSADRAFT_10970 [Dunaliella salina]|eukprot:KAF5832983.1 hypothetical protein DUNSADRAFT_10970 [Dunaliella salina]
MRFGMQLLHTTFRRNLGISALRQGSAGSVQSVAFYPMLPQLSLVQTLRPSLYGGTPRLSGCKTMCKARKKGAGEEGEGLSALQNDNKGGSSTQAKRRTSKAAAASLDLSSSSKSMSSRAGLSEDLSLLRPSSSSGRGPATTSPPAQEETAACSLHDDLPPEGSPLWNTRLWVTFSDLHVDERTLQTCLKVLRRVRNEAIERGAGILFLGDWWEIRGTLPVEPLDLVLDELSTWTEAGLPMLMLVGNHDQVDLGGEMHALKPLAKMSRDFHVFTRPTLFRNALWLPYRREEVKLRSAIEAAVHAKQENHPALPDELRCVFAHADVQTAKMNYRTQAKDGLPPALFRDFPVYTGHYHLPHSVPNSNITYIGSPYQVHRNEAGERKRLLVLDADQGWCIREEIPLDVGPRFYKYWGRNLSPQIPPMDTSLTSSALLAESNVGESTSADIDNPKPGDVVKWVLQSEEADDPEVQHMIEGLKAKGVHVEQAMAPAKQRGPRMVVSEEVHPHQVLEMYAASAGMSEAGLAEAHAALQRALEDTPQHNFPHVDLELLECEIEGYGPFKERQVYPLQDRGLRVITGDNLDDSGSSSNGAGKSSLVTAPLWALTGDMLTRTESGSGRATGTVDSMLNDDSRLARVVLRGNVNGMVFVVERAVSKGATSKKKGQTSKLSLILDGKDHTQQTIRLTQDKIDSLFNCSLARSSVFFGQNDITNLLEANDADFKELLRRVVAMDVWPKARAFTCSILIIFAWIQINACFQRTEVRQQLAKAAGQLDLLKEQQEARRKQEQAKREQLQTWEEQQLHRMTQLRSAIDSSQSEALSLVAQLDQKEAQVRLAHVQEGLLQWVGGLLPAGQQAKTDGAVQAAEYLMDPSTERTQEWLSSMSDLQPVCDKCGQQVEVAHFERRIHEMKAEVQAAQDQHKAALEQHHLACAALDGISKELLQVESVVEFCRHRHEEQAQLELQQQQEAMLAEKQAAKERELAERRALQAEQEAFEARQRQEQQALEAERAAFEARQRTQKESMALCRSLEQQQLGARSAIQQGHAALAAIKAVRNRLTGGNSLLERRHTSGADMLAAGPDQAGAPDARAPGGTIQGAVLVVELASASAMLAVEALGALLTEVEQKAAELQIVQMEGNPHKGQLEMLREQLVQSESVLEECASQLSSLEQRYAALDEANKALGGAGVQSYVLEGVLGHLQTLAAYYMQQLANNMVLELSATKAKASSKGDGEDSMEKIDKVVKYRTPSGENRIRSLFQLSGGERRRVALALCLAFADLVKQYGRLSCNVLVLDEVLQQLDQEGCIRVADLLRELPLSSVFVVGQAHSFVTEAFEKMDTVVKKDGYSTISITP